MSNPTARINVEAKPTPSRVRVIGRSLSIAPYTCIKCAPPRNSPPKWSKPTGGTLCPECYHKARGKI